MNGSPSPEFSEERKVDEYGSVEEQRYVDENRRVRGMDKGQRTMAIHGK